MRQSHRPSSLSRLPSGVWTSANRRTGRGDRAQGCVLRPLSLPMALRFPSGPMPSCRRARGEPMRPNDEFGCQMKSARPSSSSKEREGPFKAAALGLPLGCQTAPHARRRLSPARSSRLSLFLSRSFAGSLFHSRNTPCKELSSRTRSLFLTLFGMRKVYIFPRRGDLASYCILNLELRSTRATWAHQPRCPYSSQLLEKPSAQRDELHAHTDLYSMLQCLYLIPSSSL